MFITPKIIDWKKYIDHIYIVDYINTAKDVTEKFNSELERVGIDRNDQSFVTTFININTPIYRNIFKNFFKNCSGFVTDYTYATDVTLGHYYCMKLAQAKNYDKILILENDAIFYDNLYTIEIILNNAINSMNDGIFDLFLGGSGALDINGSNINYSDLTIHVNIDLTKHICLGTTFNIYNQKAYNYFINLIENGNFYVIDEYINIYKDNIKIGLSNIYICVQCFWDLKIENLYKHYNMLKPPKEKILEIFNFIKNDGFWLDFRNIKKIFCDCIEHYNLQEQYKNEYELIKSYIQN